MLCENGLEKNWNECLEIKLRILQKQTGGGRVYYSSLDKSCWCLGLCWQQWRSNEMCGWI